MLLKRIKEINNATLGELYINNKFVCYTLEDRVRSEKIKHETAIPSGTYNLIINQSVRFKKKLPLLLNVPNFTGIRIHAGNTIEDTSGCILVGLFIKEDRLLQSNQALSKVMKLIRKPTIITIQDIPIEIPTENTKEEIKEIIEKESTPLSVEEIVIKTNQSQSKEKKTWITYFLNLLIQIWNLLKPKS